MISFPRGRERLDLSSGEEGKGRERKKVRGKGREGKGKRKGRR